MGVPNLAKEPKNLPKFSHMDIGINPNFFIYVNPDEIIKEHLKDRKINNILSGKSPQKNRKKGNTNNINPELFEKSEIFENMNNSNKDINTSSSIINKENNNKSISLDKELKNQNESIY